MIVRLCAIAVVSTLLVFCSGDRTQTAVIPSGVLVFEDSFERLDLGNHWRSTGPGYSIEKGKLRVQGAHNHPLWLLEKLPRNTRVDFSAIASQPAVDIKFELFGDGKSYATKDSYSATSYVLVLGGWNNSRSIIARMNEHGKDRKVRTSPLGETNRVYHFSTVRQGNELTWFVDGKLFLTINDSDPLEGQGHEFFAFNNWESEVFFDDLKVYRIKKGEGK